MVAKNHWSICFYFHFQLHAHIRSNHLNNRKRSIIYKTQKSLEKQEENSNGGVSSPGKPINFVRSCFWEKYSLPFLAVFITIIVSSLTRSFLLDLEISMIIVYFPFTEEYFMMNYLKHDVFDDKLFRDVFRVASVCSHVMRWNQIIWSSDPWSDKVRVSWLMIVFCLGPCRKR